MCRFLVSLLVAIGTLCPPQAVAQTIGETVDNESLTWGTSGASVAPWFGQTAVTYDGIDAARSGAVGDGEQSDLTTTVSGPGTLSFWWKVSSEYNPGAGRYDVLYFWYGDSQGMQYLSGEEDWRQAIVQIPKGQQTLNWSYAKDISGSAGMDAGFLDQVVWTPDETSVSVELLGTELWTRSEHMEFAQDMLRGAAFDRDGNPVFVGDFDADSSNANTEGHVLILSPDGETVMWETIVSSGSPYGHEYLYGVHVDGVGNLYIVGQLSGDTYPPYYSAQILRKYSPSRELLWERLHYDGYNSDARAVTTDAAGNVYTVGQEYGSEAGVECQWTLLKYSADGTLQPGFPIRHNHSPIASRPDIATAVVVDDEGSMYVGGYLGGVGANTRDWHVRKYNASGVFQWSDTIVGPNNGSDLVAGLVLDGMGHLYACGGLGIGGYSGEWLLVKYACNPSGGGTTAERVWERTYTNAIGYAYSLVMGPDDFLYVAGTVLNVHNTRQSTVMRIDPVSGEELDRGMAELSGHNQINSIAIRDGQLAWAGIWYNHGDWDYLYGLLSLGTTPDPPESMDALYLY